MIDKSKYTRQELIDFVVANQKSIISQKKAALKKADAITFDYSVNEELQVKGIGIKSKAKENEIIVKVVINSTNILDSHDDVHIKGLWKKSLQENKNLLHLQEHKLQFDKIISDGQDLQSYVEDTTFKDLGFDFEGKTQALIFESNIKKERNPFMYEQYAKGYVKEHSVGMYYVKVVTCVNDKSYKEEYKNWENYIGQVANKDVAEEQGYFFAILEAKAVEGSAVPKGSNFATPTIETVQHNDKALEEQAAEKALEQKQAADNKRKEFYLKKLRDERV